jgi:hypothetical protein
MKKITVSSVLLILCALMMAILALKLSRIDTKVDELARPARLFTPKLIEAKFAPRKEWDVNVSKDHDAFFYVVSQQTFNWLGRGMQVVVFESQDGRYVVKFFQLGRLKEPESRGFLKNIFSSEPESKRQERRTHREELFTSSKMCFEELQEETGIVYVHLNKTKDKIHGMKLVDKYGQSHRIRGDDTCFIVQKKVKFVIPTFVSLMEKGEVEKAKQRIVQVFDLLLSLARKGFVDGDDALVRNNNIGLATDRAIYIDTGHICRVQNLDVYERMLYEFRVRLDPLEHWLNVMYPDLGAYYAERREAMLDQLKQEKSAKDC